ncbi:MAG: GyrI-like domain-containing protein [Syntrophaceae bacterium]
MGRLLTIIGIVAAVALLVLAYYGLFAPVVFTEKEMGPYVLVYEKHLGEYKQTASIVDRVSGTLLGEDGIFAGKGFGLFYDNPKTVETANLRSIAGCIVENVPDDKIKKLRDNFLVGEFPEAQCVVAELPYKGYISIVLGTLRVYPKLAEYMQARQYTRVPVMEIYDKPNAKIIYVVAYTLGPYTFENLLGPAGTL